MKESAVEDYLVEQCEKYGALCPKVVWPGRRGCPDREVILPWGHIDKVELKRPKGGRYEAGQERAHKEFADRGIPVYLLNTEAKVDVYVQWRVKNGRHNRALYSVPIAVRLINEGDGWDIEGAG